MRNLVEITVEFIEGIIMETMGKAGLKWTPMMLSFFIFIYLCNVPGIIPIIYMPATARMAIPLFLAIIVWLIYNGVGFKEQKLGYLTHMLWPPGVPVAMKPLVGLIEFVSNILLRPFALAIRLFANMLAGHMLLVTFAILTEELIASGNVFGITLSVLPFFMLHVHHRLRDPRRLPAGVHLHDPRLRVHRLVDGQPRRARRSPLTPTILTLAKSQEKQSNGSN